MVNENYSKIGKKYRFPIILLIFSVLKTFL